MWGSESKKATVSLGITDSELNGSNSETKVNEMEKEQQT